MPLIASQQAIVGDAPQTVFTVPAGLPSPGAVLKVRVNGVAVPFSWSGASQITLKAAAPSRSILDFDSESDPNKAVIAANASLDFPSIAAQSASELTVSNVGGASPGDIVNVGLPSNAPLGLVYSAYVSAANTVKVRASNITAAAIDAPAGVFRVAVQKV